MPTDTFLEALTEHLSALQARDLGRFAATLGSEVAVVDGVGTIVHGREPVLRSHAEWFASADPWTFDYTIAMTRHFGSAAIALIDVTYRQLPSLPPARFLLSLLFARLPNGPWLFVYDQNTVIAGRSG